MVTIPEMLFGNCNFDFVKGNNTFRMGTKYKDLVPGQFLEAFNVEHTTKLGDLVVASIHVMPLKDALYFYASENHGVLESGVPGAAAEAELKAILQKVYPDLDLDDDSLPCCVVEFDP